MKRFTLRRVVCCLLLCLLIVFMTGLGYMYYTYSYMPGQTINGVDVSFKNSDIVYTELLSEYPSDIELLTPDATYTLPFDFIDVLDATDVKHNNFSDWLVAKPIIVEPFTVNVDRLTASVSTLYKPCTNAALVKGSDGFYIQEEDYGFDYVDTLCDYIIECIDQEIYSIDCTDYIKSPMVTSYSLIDEFDCVKWLNDFSVTYSTGYTIDYNTLKDYINGCDSVIPDDYWDRVLDYLDTAYTTSNKDIQFQSNSMELIDVSYYTYGHTLDKDRELEFLKKCINDRTSVSNRTPYITGYDNIGNTYLEVSIKDQHLWYYIDGVMFMDSDVVTGTKGRNDTPTGVFYISECIDGKYLRGADYVTWVDKWMRITNRGHGFHDASWRSQFGSDIYTYDGSHGCINLPKEFAYRLFEHVTVGLPVIIY